MSIAALIAAMDTSLVSIEPLPRPSRFVEVGKRLSHRALFSPSTGPSDAGITGFAGMHWGISSASPMRIGHERPPSMRFKTGRPGSFFLLFGFRRLPLSTS